MDTFQQYLCLKKLFMIHYYPLELVNVIINFSIAFDNAFYLEKEQGIYVYYDNPNDYQPDNDYDSVYKCTNNQDILRTKPEWMSETTKIYLCPNRKNAERALHPLSKYVYKNAFKNESLSSAIKNGNLERVEELFTIGFGGLPEIDIEYAMDQKHYKVIAFLYHKIKAHIKWLEKNKSCWYKNDLTSYTILKYKMMDFLQNYGTFIYCESKFYVEMYVNHIYLDNVLDLEVLPENTKIYLISSYNDLSPTSNFITKDSFKFFG